MAKTTAQTLIDDLSKTSYTPRTAADMKAEADAYAKTIYDAKRLAANQTNAVNQLALDQQIAGLATTYNNMREKSAENFANAYSQANRQSIKSGMQRSSYNNATLANITTKGNEAQQDINNAQTTATTDLQAKKTLFSQQLADILSQYSTSEVQDALTRLGDLQDTDYTRQQDALNLQLSAAQTAATMESNAATLAEDKRQFDALHPTSSGGGSKGGGGGKGGGYDDGKGGIDSSFSSKISFQERLNAAKLGYGSSNAAVAAMRAQIKRNTTAPATQNPTGKRGFQE